MLLSSGLINHNGNQLFFRVGEELRRRPQPEEDVGRTGWGFAEGPPCHR